MCPPATEGEESVPDDVTIRLTVRPVSFVYLHWHFELTEKQ